MQSKFTLQVLLSWLIKGGILPLFLVFFGAFYENVFAAAGQGVLQEKITLHVQDMKIKNVLKEIEKRCSTRFGYQHQIFNLDRIVTLSVEESPLIEVLNNLFDHAVAFEDMGGLVIIKRLEVEAILSVPIKGKVTDETGASLPGVNVIEKGTSNGTVTDVDGGFSLNLDNANTIIIVSAIGYLSEEIMVGAQDILNVTLRTDTKQLDEVVVVGYGTQKKVNLTGAVSSVSSKDFADRPITSVANSLQGKLPGVTIVTNNGQPGRDGGSFYIRGIGTGLGSSPASSSPLVIVNGVVASLDELNPYDIENLTVLKDAASAAIYGARASNGVILVTTKKGTKGKLRVNYDWYGGIQQVNRKPEFLPSWDEAQLYNEARTNEGKAAKWTARDIELFKNGSDQTGAHPNTDWLSLLYAKPGFQQSHNLSLLGGDEKSSYMFSLGYLDQSGNIEKTNYKKYNARFGVTSQITKKIGVEANLGLLYSPFTEPVSSYATSFVEIPRMIYRLSSIIPARWGNGAFGYVTDGSPLAWLEAPNLNSIDSYTITGNIGADWSPVKGLHVKPAFGYRLALSNRKQFVAQIQYYTGGPEGTPQIPSKLENVNNLLNVDEKTSYTLTQIVAEYEKTFGKHYFKLLGGASREYSIYNYLKGYRQGFLNDAVTELNAAPKDGQQAEGYSNDWALESFFGRFNYDYDSKYLLEANIRYDGSSRFASGKRYGAFPSVSVGWVISEESFFDNLRKGVLNFAKLRAAWGRLGNQQITDYPTYSTIATGQNYSFNQNLVSGIAPKDGSNADITWERTVSSTIGVDLSFLANKLALSVEYFERNTNNILMQLPVGAPFGLTSPYQNAGAMSNKGWEFTSGYHNKIRHFTYDITGNLTFISNKVTELKGTGPLFPSNATFYDVGYPFQSLYGYESLGIFQNDDQVKNSAVIDRSVAGPGDLIYKDQNDDGVINSKDRVFLGQYFPKVTYGITVNTGWKNWDLTFFVQGAGGVKANGGAQIGQIGAGDVQRPTSAFLDRWTPENHSNTFPRAWFSNYQNDPVTTPSSFWVKNASYLRMKNLTVGFNLPKEALNRFKITKARFYYSGQNIFTITEFYKWIDPEIGSSAGIYTYPQVKTHTVGVNIGF